jgi:hypothetical protein
MAESPAGIIDSGRYILANCGNVPSRVLGAAFESSQGIGSGFASLGADTMKGASLMGSGAANGLAALLEGLKMAAKVALNALGQQAWTFAVAYGPTIILVVVVGGTVYLAFTHAKKHMT